MNTLAQVTPAEQPPLSQLLCDTFRDAPDDVGTYGAGTCDRFPREHIHCCSCQGVIVLVGDSRDELPSDAVRCTRGIRAHVTHRACSTKVSLIPNAERVAPIVTPLASVDAAMERALPALEYTTWSALVLVGSTLRDDIAESTDLGDLNSSDQLLAEIEERVTLRRSEITHRMIVLTMRPLERAGVA